MRSNSHIGRHAINPGLCACKADGTLPSLTVDIDICFAHRCGEVVTPHDLYYEHFSQPISDLNFQHDVAQADLQPHTSNGAKGDAMSIALTREQSISIITLESTAALASVIKKLMPRMKKGIIKWMSVRMNHEGQNFVLNDTSIEMSRVDDIVEEALELSHEDNQDHLLLLVSGVVRDMEAEIVRI